MSQSALPPPPYLTERIEFRSDGHTVVGLMFIPTHVTEAVAGVVVLGPFGFVKEMSPAEYGPRLAEAGIAALIFDPRGSGESGGAVRRLEDPTLKIEDVVAATTYLAGRKEVDPHRLGALGICQGSSEIIAAASQDKRLRALALVSGQYLYAKNLDGFFGGGGPTLRARIARGQAALEHFKTSGAVDYLPVVDAADRSAGLPWPEIHDWYQPWTTKKWGEPSRWENRYAAMSDAFVWTFNVDDFAPQVRQPTLIIHGEKSDGGVEAAQHVFDLISARDKKLSIAPGVFHTRFYDDPLVVGPSAAHAADWLATHLA